MMKKWAILPLLVCSLAWANDQTTLRQAQQQRLQFERNQQFDWLNQQQYQAKAEAQTLTDLSQQCLPFEQLVFVGVKLIDPRPFAPKPGECLNEVRLNQLSQDLTVTYLSRGYIHNPFRFENDGSGTLRLVVTEGKVASLRTQSKRLNLATLFPHLIGKPLNVSDLDQGLDQANKMPNVSASVDVLPKTSGEIDLIFSNVDRSPISGSFGLDNRASQMQGVWQVKSQLSVANPLNLSDSLYVSAHSTLKRQANYAHSVSLFQRIPYGNWTFNSFAGLSRSFAMIQLPNNRLPQRNRQWHLGFKLDYLLNRGQNHISTLAFGLERTANRSEFGGSRLALQSPNLTTAQLQLSHLQRLAQGSLVFNLTYERGLRWWNASRQPDHQQPQGQFDLWQANLIWQHFHRWQEQLFAMSHELRGQHSLDYLYASKQAELLGEYNVRGFKAFSSSAENQLLLKNQFSWIYQQNRWQAEPYLALDLGIQKASSGNNPTSKALGYGLGVKFNHTRFHTELSYSQGKRFANSQQNSQKEKAVVMSLNLLF